MQLWKWKMTLQRKPGFEDPFHFHDDARKRIFLLLQVVVLLLFLSVTCGGGASFYIFRPYLS